MDSLAAKIIALFLAGYTAVVPVIGKTKAEKQATGGFINTIRRY